MNVFIAIMAIAALPAGVMAMKFYFDAKALRHQLNEEQRHNEKLVGDHVARETGLETDLSKWQKVASKRAGQIEKLVRMVAFLREAVYVLGKENVGGYINDIGVVYHRKVRLEGGPSYCRTLDQLNAFNRNEALEECLNTVNAEMHEACKQRADRSRESEDGPYVN